MTTYIPFILSGGNSELFPTRGVGPIDFLLIYFIRISRPRRPWDFPLVGKSEVFTT